MRRRIKVFASIVLMAAMSIVGLNVGTAVGVKADVLDDSKIIILSTNDAHCSIDAKDNIDPSKAIIGYAGVAEVYKQQKSIYSNVALVDAGDHIQGAPIGILTTGQDIISIMNKVGYTASAIGNHEFDYGIDRLLELTHSSSNNALKAKYPYVCCNFVKLSNNELVYDPYTIEEYEYNGTKVKVAYLGITTPETIAISSNHIFRDSDGELLYGFCQDDSGDKLYSQIQKYVDEARKSGADYVIALGHVGQESRPDKWRSDTIVRNTSGIDAFIDGHSHEAYIQNVVNKDGKNVIITQSGRELNALGLMTIDIASGAIKAEVINAPVARDPEVEAYIAGINAKFNELLDEKIAETTVELNVFKEDNYNWLVRESETNMGDLVTDAFRIELQTDISIIGGGSVRNKFEKGDITFRDALSVQPFDNEVAVIKASGQQILDALEMGVRKYPEPSGAFLQVSGMSYDIAIDVPSSVKLDDVGMFVSVEGEYRVRNVIIGDEPLDINKMYTIGGASFALLESGDGLSMFEGCESLITGGTKDIELFTNYLRKLEVVGDEYSNLTGQGRIRFVKASEQQMEEQKQEQKQEETPVTGDNSKPMLYVALLLLSGALMLNCKKVDLGK